MKKFNYTITDSLGIHARPAGMLVKEAERFNSSVTIEKDGRTADAKRLFSLMGMDVKAGETVSLKIEGPDEDEAASAIESFFAFNL